MRETGERTEHHGKGTAMVRDRPREGEERGEIGQDRRREQTANRETAKKGTQTARKSLHGSYGYKDTQKPQERAYGPLKRL